MAKTLYLKPWDYNKAVLLDMLDNYVEANGGTLYGYYKPGTIVRSDHKGHEFGRTETNHCDNFGGYTTFVLDGDYFYVELDDNPFFEFHCSRIPLDSNGKYVGTYCSNELSKKEWLYDCLFGHDICDADLKECFQLFLNEVLKMPKSQRYYERKRTRVPNRYDGGYHYEMIDVSDKRIKEPSERKELNY